MCFCAVWKLGAVLLPLCTGYTKEEMLHCVQAADIDVIVADGEYLETLRRFELPVKILPLRTLTENLSPVLHRASAYGASEKKQRGALPYEKIL